MSLFVIGRLETKIAEGRLTQHDVRASGGRDDLLCPDSERQPDDLARIGLRDLGRRERRVRRAGERLKVDALLVREHLAGQVELDHRDADARPRLAVDPHRAAVQRKGPAGAFGGGSKRTSYV